MRVVTSDTAAALVRDGDTILTGGSGAGHAVPEALMAAIERRFLSTGQPRHVTSIHPVGLGDRGARGAAHFAHPGLLKRVVTGTLVDSPSLAEMVARNEVEAYTLPQGALSQLVREIAAGRPGLITHVGLHTFVDPRLGGGRQSQQSQEDLVSVVEIAGREWLMYKPFSIDVAFLRGTTADEDGNVSMEQEAVFGEMLSMAQATRRCGGLVVVQVKRLAKRGALPGKSVKIPGILVDLVVVDPTQTHTYFTSEDPAYSGELRVPLDDFPAFPLDERKIVSRRCAMELRKGAVCNVGAGICTGIGPVAAEEGVLDEIVLTNEQGLIGGVPAGANGRDAGAARNYWAMVDQPYQFDFYDGGGIDIAFLSAAEIDAQGSVNVSRFGDRIVGPGGFINISQNAKTLIFGGTFTAGGLEVACKDGRLKIVQEGRHRKFVAALQQICYSSAFGRARGQTVTFVTERAVFRTVEDGLELIEVAPGIDVENNILAHMEFRPKISAQLRQMDSRLFLPQPMHLKSDMAGQKSRQHPRMSALDAVS
ncbi:acyl CoA:acetate/3-ketoacid CoA transferase [Bradyrhizobium sp.]|uniref:acyl CoA:acetate/3-ketoacid CoA transferase n=1 Tax=Bradyrhizobium sp. TaxID=376 RepID=UPI003C71C58C